MAQPDPLLHSWNPELLPSWATERDNKNSRFSGCQPWAPILPLSLPGVYEPEHASEPFVPHAQTRLLMGEQAGRGGYWAPIRGNRAPAMSPRSLNEESLSLRPPPRVFPSKHVRIAHGWFSELERTLPLASPCPLNKQELHLGQMQSYWQDF